MRQEARSKTGLSLNENQTNFPLTKGEYKRVCSDLEIRNSHLNVSLRLRAEAISSFTRKCKINPLP